jgi:hypothetical protein
MDDLRSWFSLWSADYCRTREANIVSIDDAGEAGPVSVTARRIAQV